MSFFGWAEEKEQLTEVRMAVEEQLRNMTARRKILNEKITGAMLSIQKWEIESSRVSHLEDVLRDDLEKMAR